MVETKIYIGMAVAFALAAWVALELGYDEWRKFRRRRRQRTAGGQRPSEKTGSDPMDDGGVGKGPLAAA